MSLVPSSAYNRQSKQQTKHESVRSDEEEWMDLEKVLTISPPKAAPTSSTMTSTESRGDSNVSDGKSQFKGYAGCGA
jgi:hypothetical protein